MPKMIIALNNGRLKRINNRFGGDTSSLETRHRRHENEQKITTLRRLDDLAARRAIEECDLIGPRGVINLRSLDYVPAKKNKDGRRNSGSRRNQRRIEERMRNVVVEVVGQQSAVAVSVKAKRPPIKVFIDESGIMRAVKLA